MEARLKPAVGYIRMSTSKQEDSPARQRAEIERLAVREGYAINQWYEDHSQTGTESKNRPQFLQLLKDVRKRSFGAVLLYEHSRFSREDVFDAMEHWKTLREAGVKLVSCQRGELRFDDLAGLITAIVGQHEARGESIRIGQRSLSGRIQKTRQGVHTSRPPFGFDREIIDEAGQVVRRVPWHETFQKPKNWKANLVPSADPEVVSAVRSAFHSVLEGRSLRSIAIDLTRRGFVCRFGATFNAYKVRLLLTNPVYAGVLRMGKNPSGKFARCEELIEVPDAHPGFVDMGTFQRVQTHLDGNYRENWKSEPGQHLLTGLVFCHHCGRRMSGVTYRGPKYRGGMYRQYTCSVTQDGIDECPVHPGIDAEGLEDVTLSLFRDAVLCDANREPLMDAARRLQAQDEAPSLEEQQLVELDRKIERGTENLALADGENFASLARLLDQWREQRRTIQAQLNKATQKRGLSPEILNAFNSLTTIRDNLHLANRVDLSAALMGFVSRITVGREQRENGGHVLRRAFGAVEFRPEFVSVDPVPFDDWDVYPTRGYVEVATYVLKAGRPVRLAELVEAIGAATETVRKHAYRAELAGLIEISRGVRGRWEATAKQGVTCS